MKTVKYLVPQIRPVVKDAVDTGIWGAVDRFWKTVKKPVSDTVTKENVESETLEIMQFSKNVPPIIPPFKPIGRFEFDDEKFKVTPQEMENAPFEFPESRSSIVGRDEPICRDYTQLKGANNDLFCMAISRGITRKPSIYTCKWFTFRYYHSDTFLGNIVKSRPGIVIICHNSKIFNSQISVSGEVPKDIRKSAFPFKSSVYRSKLKKFLRKNFMELYLKDEEFSKVYNGLYEYSVKLYPHTKEDEKDFILNLSQCLKEVAKRQKPTSQKDVLADLNRLPWHDVQRVLKRNKVEDFYFRDYERPNKPRRSRN